MAVIDHIDGPNRDIYLSADTVLADFQPMDAYKEMRALRRTDESLRKFDLFLQAKGYEPTGGGKFTARYVVQLDGTRFVPYDTSHELTVIGTVITDDGQSGVACFDRSPLSPSVVVDINYIPPQVEIIELGTSGLTPEESAAILQIESDVININTAIGNIEGDIGIIKTDITSLQGDVASINTDIGTITVDISEIKDEIITINTAIGDIALDISQIKIDLAFIKAIESGEWKIENNQMIFFDTSDQEIARFNLFNVIGIPTNDDVYNRKPV